MKHSTYIKKLEEAILLSKEKRWELLARNPYIIVPPYYLCFMHLDMLSSPIGYFYRLKHSMTEVCILCPLHRPAEEDRYIVTCSDRWDSQRKAENDAERRAAALQIINELNAINIKEWADDLLKKGILEEE